MASQKDFFDSEDQKGRKGAKFRISSSLELSKNMNNNNIVYLWVVLFEWDVDNEAPFQIHDISKFNDTDIHKELLAKNLGPKSRTSKLRHLSPFPGRIFSLFGKVGMGVSKKVRTEIVKDLNSTYRKMISKGDCDIETCLRNLVEEIPYRFVFLFSIVLYLNYYLHIFISNRHLFDSNDHTTAASSQSDSLSPSILDRTKSTVASPGSLSSPAESSIRLLKQCLDPESWESEFAQFPEHLIFFQKLRTAQVQANGTGKRVQLCWRTHRTSMGPKDGILHKIDYVSKLITALRNVKTPIKGEKEVNFLFIICYVLFYIVHFLYLVHQWCIGTYACQVVNG